MSVSSSKWVALYVVVLAGTVAQPGRAAQNEGATLYDGACAQCHDAPAQGSRAPNKEALRDRSPEAIVDALTGGAMRYQGLSLSGSERRAIAAYLTGKSFGGDISGAAQAKCTSVPPLRDAGTSPEWNGWGPTLANTHFQSAGAGGITAADVPRLSLKWAFGFPDTTSAWGQPSIVGGRLFVGGENGTVYALDPTSGCVVWTFAAQGSVRASISIGGGRAYFSDQKGYAYALDAATGREIWRRKVEDHPLVRLTGSPALYDGRLYVPTSSYEETGKGPTYACCTFRGSIVALDAKSGETVWRAYTITEQPKVLGKRADGVEAWGPAGGAVWSAPTIDARRHAIYVGVGNTYAGIATAPAANAVAAFDMTDGRMLWAKQVAAPDVFGCRPGEANCGDKPGPDFDFGSSPSLITLPSGRDAIVIGNKSGIGYAMDPDKQGAILWEYRAGKGSTLGGIEWGAAVDAGQAYFPVADGNSPAPGGLHAVTLTTGQRAWFAPPAPRSAKCAETTRGCNSGQSAAITVIPGAVLSGAMDGMLRAYSTKDGTVLWEYDTSRDYDTVNHVKAHGGSINGPAPVVVGGMLYVNSGYGGFGSHTGNVLLAFGVQ